MRVLYRYHQSASGEYFRFTLPMGEATDLRFDVDGVIFGGIPSSEFLDADGDPNWLKEECQTYRSPCTSRNRAQFDQLLDELIRASQGEPILFPRQGYWLGSRANHNQRNEQYSIKIFTIQILNFN